MATSIRYDMVAAVESEISCPVCLEEFEEPKCLPNCAHNVCQHCLGGMEKKRNEAIECPVCRVESIIPNGGVAAFPTNHLLVRLIERTPGRKEKKLIKEAVKNCKEKLEGAKTALKEMEARFETVKIQDEETKQRIKSLAEKITTKVREQEQKMLSQIQMRGNQKEKTFETLKSNTMELCGNTSSCIQTVECVLQIDDVEDLKSVKVEELNNFSASLETGISEANCEFTQACNVCLTDTDLIENLTQDVCLQGKLTVTTSTPQDVTCASGSGMDFSRCGTLIQTIDSTSCGIASFNPSAVAVTRNSDHLVVLDGDTNWVHIFNKEKEPVNKFHIKFGDLWDIAVSSGNEIVVVNRESNRLLHYDMNGNFKKKFVPLPKQKVKFSSLTVDVFGRFIMASSFYDYDGDDDDILSCILVYDPSGNSFFLFGEDMLITPVQAVFLNDKYFVTDSSLCSVMVFDRNGDHLDEFGYEHLKSPRGIAADHSRGNIVVCDIGSNSIQSYSQAGILLHHFKTAHKPRKVAFTKNYEELVIRCEIDVDKSYIQIVTYS